MAEIRAFKGLRYNSEVVSYEKVTAPPYDVIDEDERNALLSQDPHNVVRLILGDQSEGDTEENSRYTRARDTLAAWCADGSLRHDEAPAYYILRQRYTNKYGEKKETIGVVAALRLSPFGEGVVLPHERTLSKPKADRLELIKKTATNLSQVYLMYRDDDDAVYAALTAFADANAPVATFTDKTNVENIVWVMPEAEGAKMKACIDAKTLYIADGHHRYETMIAYRDYRREVDGMDADADYEFGMVYLTACSERYQSVYPTHRLIFDIPQDIIGALPKALETHFTVEAIPVGDDIKKARDLLFRFMHERKALHTFGLFRKGDNVFYQFTLKGEAVLKEKMKDEEAIVRELDVPILHTLVLEELLSLDKERQAAQTNLTYTRDDDFAIDAVVDGDYQAVFLLNATPLTSVLDVSDAKAIMPQKSTYFFPKLPSGVVFRTMH